MQKLTTIRFFKSNDGKLFVAMGDYMYRAERSAFRLDSDSPDVDGVSSRYNLSQNWSLSRPTVRRIFRKGGTRVGHGWWRTTIKPSLLKIGCQVFTGDNLKTLKVWAGVD